MGLRSHASLLWTNLNITSSVLNSDSASGWHSWCVPFSRIPSPRAQALRLLHRAAAAGTLHGSGELRRSGGSEFRAMGRRTVPCCAKNTINYKKRGKAKRNRRPQQFQAVGCFMIFDAWSRRSKTTCKGQQFTDKMPLASMSHFAWVGWRPSLLGWRPSL